MLKRILVELSHTPFSRAAIRYALDLARRHEASVTGVGVIDLRTLEAVVPTPVLVSAYSRAVVEHQIRVTRNRIEDEIAAFREACRAAEVACDVREETGEPLSTFTADCRYHDLAIVGLRGFFDYGVVPEPHDAVYRLFTQGVRPILAVSEYARVIRRALVVYDGSMDSAKAMRRFVQMRLWPECSITIATFGKPPDEAARLLSDAADYCRAHGFETGVRAVEDAAGKRLLPMASEMDADVIVLSSLPGGILRRIRGESLMDVIRDSERPLFLSH